MKLFRIMLSSAVFLVFLVSAIPFVSATPSQNPSHQAVTPHQILGEEGFKKIKVKKVVKAAKKAKKKAKKKAVKKAIKKPAKKANSGSSETPAPGTDSSSLPETITVNIENFKFQPETVTIKKGGTVKFVQIDSVSHAVVAESVKAEAPNFGSDLLQKGQSYSYTFSTAGTFGYFCGPHPSMTGKVVVTE